MSKSRKKVIRAVEHLLWEKWDELNEQVREVDNAMGEENSPDSLLVEWVEKMTEAHSIVFKLRALQTLKKSKN